MSGLPRLVVVKSVHHQNPARIAHAMADVLGAECAPPEELPSTSLDQCRLVGFGSGVYYGQLHESLFEWLRGLPDTPEAPGVIEPVSQGSFSGAQLRPARAGFTCYFRTGGSRLRHNAMNRRSACICVLAFLKTSLVSSVALAAQEAARTVSRIAGPRWNVNGDWSPGLDELQGHLRAAHGIAPGTLGIEDLLTLHDNDHNRRGYQAGHGHKKATKGQSKGYAGF